MSLYQYKYSVFYSNRPVSKEYVIMINNNMLVPHVFQSPEGLISNPVMSFSHCTSRYLVQQKINHYRYLYLLVVKVQYLLNEILLFHIR